MWELSALYASFLTIHTVCSQLRPGWPVIVLFVKHPYSLSASNRGKEGRGGWKVEVGEAGKELEKGELEEVEKEGG